MENERYPQFFTSISTCLVFTPLFEKYVWDQLYIFSDEFLQGSVSDCYDFYLSLYWARVPKEANVAGIEARWVGLWKSPFHSNYGDVPVPSGSNPAWCHLQVPLRARPETPHVEIKSIFSNGTGLIAVFLK